MEAPIAHLQDPRTPLAIIGLGYVGLPLAVEFGKHRPVVGFDINPGRIAELRAGRDSTREVTPEDLDQARHLSYSSGLDCLAEPPPPGTCDAVILAVAHRDFIELGAAGLRRLGKAQSILYDVKSVLPLDSVDARL
jgi:UDP-N-acetyl-D-mannosaminuronate dehydrogenase